MEAVQESRDRVSHVRGALEALTEALDVIDTSIFAPKFNSALKNNFLKEGTCLIGCEFSERCTSLGTAIVTFLTSLHEFVKGCLCL